MRRPDLLNSGAFRLALLFSALFALGAVVLVTSVNIAVSRYAAYTTATALRDESLLLRSEAQARGRAALAQLIVKRERIVQAHPFLYRLDDPIGRRIAGALPAPSRRDGWGEVRVAEPAEPGEAAERGSQVRYYAVRLTDGSRLVVGRNTSDLDELSGWLRLVTLWSGLGVTVLALGGGALIAAVFLRRLDGVNQSLRRIMAGRLDARVRPIGMGVEFDRLTDNLNAMLDRIEALMAGLRQVSTDIAHDLRTPLSRLRQHLEGLRELDDPGALDAAVDEATAQVDEVLATFQALLRIGQIEAGAGRASFERVDLSDLMDGVRLAYETAAEDAGKRLTARIDPGLQLNGDPRLLTQLFANLLENALRHGGDSGDITMRLSRTGPALTAVIADSGPGVPGEERGRVLERFYRRDASRSTSGSGLGLSLVAAIAHLHGAELRLQDNAPGLAVEIRFAA